ncbi:hypothetical protein [Legionella cardiaca]|uniref:Chromosome partition protein Smc n=1 Tax=Legionella cardiaca TaxID=1071983 RepID=A0ABY8AVA7_9GAMM|nr:hypothetical protein [Legionella cardiaca]WED44583.1 hypothetical protein PXX05_07285 [Legionella cardiaca]
MLVGLLAGTVIATKYIIALVVGGGVAGAGIGASTVHLLHKNQKPDVIDLERLSRQQAREDSLDELLKDTENFLEITFHDLKTNSEEMSSTVVLLKEAFTQVFQKTEELSQITHTIKESEKKRLEELEQTHAQLLLEISTLNNKLSEAEKNREILTGKLLEVGEQSQGSALKLIEAKKQLEELRLIYDAKKVELKKLADECKELRDANKLLEKQFNDAVGLLQKKQQSETPNNKKTNQEDTKVSYSNGFF